jgi:hypothetical protein
MAMQGLDLMLTMTLEKLLKTTLLKPMRYSFITSKYPATQWQSLPKWEPETAQLEGPETVRPYQIN